jgi:hypothetical protein
MYYKGLLAGTRYSDALVHPRWTIFLVAMERRATHADRVLGIGIIQSVDYGNEKIDPAGNASPVARDTLDEYVC